MTNATQSNWKVPIILLMFCAIPLAGGVARIMGLSGNIEISAENARFVEAPFPVISHILSASIFSILGAFQFSHGIRQRSPVWHRISGRIVVASGVASALSGLWMTVLYRIPAELQGGLLYTVRVLVSVAMIISVVNAVAAAKKRNFYAHRAWMIRTYALGQGAGMQVVLLMPWMIIIGNPSQMHRDIIMSMSWLINLVIAEVFNRESKLQNSAV
jgi:uncharacterized membrane protein